MTVWSPSHVNKWLECPLKWQMQREGVEGVRERWSPGMIVGTALHAGLARYFGPAPNGDPAAIASDTLTDCWPDETGEWELAQVGSKMLGALNRAMEKREELLGEEGQVVGVEVKLGEGDRVTGMYPGTADLITSHATQFGDEGRYLVVTDWKSHWSLDEYYLEKELSETERNWQLHQYAWFAQKMYGLPVKYIRKVTIRCLPSPKTWVYTHEITQERLAKWHGYALDVWFKMSCDARLAYPEGSDDDREGLCAPNWQSCRKFGRCEYYHVCH